MESDEITKWTVDRHGAGALVSILALALVTAMVAFSPQYVLRVLAWQESDAFDWKKFPARDLQPAGVPFRFNDMPDNRVPALLQEIAEVADWDSFLEDSETQAFIVLKNGEVLYERYFNDTWRDSIVTSFSVAKSFTSALIDIAIEEGFIGDAYYPEGFGQSIYNSGQGYYKYMWYGLFRGEGTTISQPNATRDNSFMSRHTRIWSSSETA
ncbi:MAG: hypothetical protein IIC79_04745 [Chloroflexi bacterium]|nr:hypothetical protein [Chloroflexota bacterium]